MSAVLNQQINMWEDKPDEMWNAVLAKDPRFDGSFVFAVKSTGIYCRPSCPSRRPRRDRVVFFPLPEAAEQAGFRACLRCKPEQTSLDESKVSMVRRACRLIEANQDETLNLEALGQHLGLSSFYLQRTFKGVMGITPRQYAEACRTNRFKSHLQTGESVTNAMYDAGYGSSSRLYERSNSELGMTPATYSRRGRKMKIDYAIAESTLGFVLVAATTRGLCSVRLGDAESILEADLRKEYEAAEIQRNNGLLAEALKQILNNLAGKQPHLDLPLDIQATAFQRQVWTALRAIPYGSTRSYSDVAKTIGRPRSVRAVARACATNPVALVIPCHRVVREDGGLGGYRWGMDRKRRLLDTEVVHRDRKTSAK